MATCTPLLLLTLLLALFDHIQTTTAFLLPSTRTTASPLVKQPQHSSVRTTDVWID